MTTISLTIYLPTLSNEKELKILGKILSFKDELWSLCEEAEFKVVLEDE